MRPQFSLRTLLALTTLLALFCYYWVIMPTRTAQRFIRAVNSEDYTTAEQLSRHNSELAFTKWKDERWGLTTEAELAPWSVRQLLRGSRDLIMHMKYFRFDENHEIEMRLSATSLGIKKPETVAMKNNAIIERTERISNIR